MEFQTKNGKVTIETEVITEIVGMEMASIPGVVGMASQHRLKDGMTELLRKESYSKGIVIKEENNNVELRVHVVVLYGIQIRQIAETIQRRIQYKLQESFGINVSKIHVKVEDVRVDG